MKTIQAELHIRDKDLPHYHGIQSEFYWMLIDYFTEYDDMLCWNDIEALIEQIIKDE